MNSDRRLAHILNTRLRCLTLSIYSPQKDLQAPGHQAFPRNLLSPPKQRSENMEICYMMIMGKYASVEPFLPSKEGDCLWGWTPAFRTHWWKWTRATKGLNNLKLWLLNRQWGYSVMYLYLIPSCICTCFPSRPLMNVWLFHAELNGTHMRGRNTSVSSPLSGHSL